MKPPLQNILVCPSCHGELSCSILREKRQDVVEGRLLCRSCSREYPIQQGIPRLHPDQSLLTVRLEEYRNFTDVSRKIEGANLAYHDLMADAYETDLSTNFIFEESCQNRIAEIIERAGEETGAESALDIGCGTGNILKYTTRTFAQAIGIDLSLNMLEKSRIYTDHLVQGTGLAIPCPDNTFDLVSCFSLVHHIYEPTLLFREMNRVLKKGGILYTDWDFNRNFFWKPLLPLWTHRMKAPQALFSLARRKLTRDQLVKAFEIAEYHVFREWLNPEEFRRLLSNLGFERVEIVYHWNCKSIFGYSPNRLETLYEMLKTAISFSMNPKYKNPIYAIIAKK